LVVNFAAYSGPSMNPTLVEPEIIEVIPYANHTPRVGDVIYFHAPTDDQDIVHRITAITSAGIHTRGDNNPADDTWLVQPSAVVGYVVAAQRGTHRRVVHGGSVGSMYHLSIRGWRIFNRLASRVLHAPYRALARTGIVRKLLPARWRPRVVVFQQTRLLMFGSIIIGRYNAKDTEWHIQRPFRLLVDEAKL
jgi:hypothetical protein